MIDAGPFSAWLAEVRAAVRGEGEAVVPCGECTACCTSSQFVHIAPDEVEAIAHIPADLLFSAPGFPPGHVLMGYDERGHCPMFVDDRCSIYAHRPRTCRTYDCRVFAAADVVPDAEAIAARTATWRFSYAAPEDEAAHESVKAVARAVEGASNTTERAVRAIMTATG